MSPRLEAAIDSLMILIPLPFRHTVRDRIKEFVDALLEEILPRP